VAKATPEDKKLDEVLLKFQRGILFLENGKHKEARTLFEGLRETYPNVGVFHNNLGVAYKRLGLMQQAQDAYRQAIEIQNSDPEPYYNLAIILREQGEFREAEEKYKAAIVLAPDFRDAHYNLAVLYDLYLNEPAQAIRHYQTYLGLGGENQEEIKIWIASLEKRIEDLRRTP
jgi:Flp pilus assembly protein TadD